ncbi:hypothetical protein [Cryobacterium tepidiphilum]|uniref:hypothetical protein n=1 Tax=Cryobacterium tepidiphilum TaxID=2486026 RepID=UPI0018F2D9D1|nr:hypothetical protein [Cryobacterium tepidiphilum]
MRARTAASVVLAAGILMGTSACNLVAPQATLIRYDASDGVSGKVGTIAIRNTLLITQGKGAANLVTNLVNEGDDPVTMTIQYTSDGSKVNETVRIKGHETLAVGTDGPTITMRNVDAEPGSLFPVFFQYGDQTGEQLLTPVLTGAMAEYSTLTPTPLPPTPTETPTPTITVEPTEPATPDTEGAPDNDAAPTDETTVPDEDTGSTETPAP